MLRNLSVSVLTLLLAAAGCARQTIPPVLLTPQTRFGLGEGYGPGIVAATARTMRFELAVAAHVVVLRVTEAGIEQVQPRYGGDPDVKPGGHDVTAIGPLHRRPPDVHAIGPDESCVTNPDPAGSIEPICVSRGGTGSSMFQSSDAPRRPPDDERGYWLLIVSDAATPPLQLEARLQALDLDDTSLHGTVVQLPGALVGGRTTNWAAYYVGFAVQAPTDARSP